MNDIASIRKEYMKQTLMEHEVASDPLDLFSRWWKQAEESHIDEVNAMTLASADEQGRPSARTVLLKGYDHRGFCFYTNYLSRKGEQMAAQPHVAAVIYWKELERQIRIEGVAEKLPASDSDAYFASRPEESRIGAWASAQSQVVESREALETLFSQYRDRYSGKEIPRPPHWGGYLIVPDRMEFWQGRPGRLHDRIEYRRATDGRWSFQRLSP